MTRHDVMHARRASHHIASNRRGEFDGILRGDASRIVTRFPPTTTSDDTLDEAPRPSASTHFPVSSSPLGNPS
ncbi:hypothetical protein [Burkholderia gladioli]|uniref:hypothetical protein n=1 Tax=Burkholderia gladioli TaxID=28095 RepID=UPI00163E766C|nr:hypothetical protein [Burkholderia gladioli]